MERPYFKSSIRELEEKFERHSNDGDFLQALEKELSFRSTDRAARLQARVVECIQSQSVSNPPSIECPVRPATPRSEITADAPVMPNSPEVSPASPPPNIPLQPITNKPEAILSAWTALEVLSPPSFRRPEDLAGGDKRNVVAVDQDWLPWDGLGETSRPQKRLYYQIVLGSIEMESAVKRLLATYTDTRAERPVARGEAILATITVDKRGCLATVPAVFVASFGWGVSTALRGELARLADWQNTEKTLVQGLNAQIQRTDDQGHAMPVDQATIHSAFNWLVKTLGLDPDLVKPPRFAIRTYQYFRNPDPPEPLLLNSFFLGDLAMARRLFSTGKAPTNLRQYLGVEKPPARRDLLNDRRALEDAISPSAIPPARWPGAGRYPLVLLQQAAVNLATQELTSGGILAVNGPPGTGKTTLLRDLVAAVVTARAEAMASFSDPSTAFSDSGERLKFNQSSLSLYRLDSRLKGFEMLVASSNNKAVENVSAELPALKAIDSNMDSLRYFATLSGAINPETETWGLIAAVLGNTGNRFRFKQTFWWDKEVGLSTYLAAAAGTPQSVEIENPQTGKKEIRPPKIVTAECPPTDHTEALRRWEAARNVFKTALDRSRKALGKLARVKDYTQKLDSFAREKTDALQAVVSAKDRETEAARVLCLAQEAARKVEDAFKRAKAAHSSHQVGKPGFFARISRTSTARLWLETETQLAGDRKQAELSIANAIQTQTTRQQDLNRTALLRQEAEEVAAAKTKRYAEAERLLHEARLRLGKRFIDNSFFSRPHDQKHKETPWIDDSTQQLRDDVFSAAIALHRAFIDAAAKPLRHNLGVLMNAFSSGILPGERQRLLPDMWSSFFLVVPLVSTTFASVERMIGSLPPESLGWLLIDEAGQALPQAAIGAITRTRRAVVVGDPLQIEPVVVLPDSLAEVICRHFGVSPDRFNAPAASVQTLADNATSYFAEFHGRHGSRTVGVPLLVHRRCSEPMFGISNAIAYERLMVQAKSRNNSPIRGILGDSTWINIEGDAVDKWCPQEGNVVLELLRRLAAENVTPDLYIVTPFVTVAENLRKLIQECGILNAWTKDTWSWLNERVGTVHTVQGREAEAVIFVLGAPAAHQRGARIWAGERPNLLNVAVTRAKEAVYVVGNRRLWQEAGVFQELDTQLNNFQQIKRIQADENPVSP